MSAGEGRARTMGREGRSWVISLTLLVATFASTLYAGAGWSGVAVEGIGDLWAGAAFAVPLMSILIAHELGHYLTARARGVAASPPYFIPMPFLPVGTLGAVIGVREPVRSRNAAIDFAAAGPFAGLAVSLVVVGLGLAESPVREVSPEDAGFIEGRSLLYLAILHGIHGAIPSGSDVFLTPTALAGWMGLLLTMINLVPCGQLDGGHVAEALLGRRYERFSRVVMGLLLLLGLGVGLNGFLGRLAAGEPAVDAAVVGGAEGFPWILWSLIQRGIDAYAGSAMTPEGAGISLEGEEETLTPARKGIAVACGVTFVLLFMPWWTRML